MHHKFSLVLGLSLAVASTATPIPANQSLAWQDCPDFVYPNSIVTSGSRLTCANLSVPLDWDNPGEQIQLGISKLPARDPNNRIGSLFYNPGGPGEQPSSFLAGFTKDPGDVHPEILDRFDWIGVDLRGTGLSESLLCDPDIYNVATPWYPSDNASFTALVEHNIAFRESCFNLTGRPLIDYMDTVSIVKDHEAVRKALGDEPITWLGQSYGTQLGSQWAELYPDSFRAMILDGVASLSQSEIYLFLGSAASNDAVLGYFFDWCRQQNATVCPAAHHNQTLEDTWKTLLARAEKDPIPAKACSSGKAQCANPNVDADTIRYITLTSLYAPLTSFPNLAKAFYEAAFNNDTTGFLSSPLPTQQNSSTIYSNTHWYALWAITCSDWVHNDSSVVDIQIKERLAESVSPLMKGTSAPFFYQHQCAGWPAPTRNPPHPINIPRTGKMPTILMTDNLYDPATSYLMGVNLRDEIGKDRAILVTREAAGHTVYFQKEAINGSTVAAMNKYLLELELPEQGTVFQS